MKSETGKLPKGQIYPLKPSLLSAALADAGIGIDVHLIRTPGDLFDAHFWPAKNMPYERLYVRMGSVPVERAADARTRVAAVIIPRLIKWISVILAADAKSPIRREEQFLNLGLRE